MPQPGDPQQQHPQQQQQQEPGSVPQQPPPAFTCGICAKRFSNPAALVQHHAHKHRMLPGP
eukprot:scaffold82273_cov18-Tisochrysis_lutea.AAC.1